MSELEEVRTQRDRLWAERVAAAAMLRIECAMYGDNDWPDNLHLADIIEKHLARSAAAAIDYWIGEAKKFETDADEAQTERERLRSLLADVAASDVAHDVARLPYVTVLIERDLWDQVRSPNEWRHGSPEVPGPR